MNFSSADKIYSLIDNIRTAEVLRAQQRALLNGFFNGDRPWTEKEAEENNQLINFNDKAGATLLHQARAQYENAFLKPANFFRVQVDAPADKAIYWSTEITKAINRELKSSPLYLHNMRSRFAGVVLHGVGPQLWWDDQNPFAKPLGIQDVYIPTDTEITMDNLTYFSVRRKVRPGELFKMTFGKGKNVSPGWNLNAVRKILDAYKDLNQNPSNYDWANHPEQMTELYKQNLTYYDADSTPVIWMQDFFYREEGETAARRPGWYRCMLLDRDNQSVHLDAIKDSKGKDQYIFQRRTPFATELSQIIHFQVGDGNNVSPFMYHSIRSLAYLLYELLWTMNRLNCQFTQHVFEQLMTWFQVQDRSDRSRLQKVLMSGPYVVIPDGLRVFTGPERYKADPQMVSQLQAQYKQKIGEATSAYTQQLDTGTQKERTKYEVQTIMAQISALMSTMLTLAYSQEIFAYQEVARRFCIKNSNSFAAKRFQNACLAKDIPSKYIDSARWDVLPEQVLGGGNKMLELAQATQLREMRPTLNPNSQLQVDRIYITALTDNPRLAEELVPHAAGPSDAIHDAELAFGSLMQGVEVTVKEGLNHVEQVATILKLMEQVVQRINQTDNMGTQQDIVGLRTAAVYAAKQIGILAQNPDNKPVVKQFQDQLGKIMNMVKAFSQRQMEQQQSKNGSGTDPEAQAKVQSMAMLAKTKIAIDSAKAKQKLLHNEQKFRQSQSLDAARAANQSRLETGKAVTSVFHEGIRNGQRGAFSEE